MSRPTLDFLTISHGRPDEVRRAIASTAGHPFERVLLLDNGTEPPLPDGDGYELFRSEENLGAAGGRNRLMREATADAVVFIDDDVTLQPGAGEAIADAFEQHPDVAAIAFKVEREDGTVLHAEQVFRMGMPVPEVATPAAYFIGIGFAVRPKVFLELGGFDDRFVYGSEEIDFAFTLFKAGHRVLYEPRAACIHRPSTAGRLPQAEPARAQLANRTQMARAHLPGPVAAIHIAAWSALMGRQAIKAGDPSAIWRGLREGFGRDIQRDPLPRKQLVEIHRLGGRVFF